MLDTDELPSLTRKRRSQCKVACRRPLTGEAALCILNATAIYACPEHPHAVYRLTKQRLTFERQSNRITSVKGWSSSKPALIHRKVSAPKSNTASQPKVDRSSPNAWPHAVGQQPELPRRATRTNVLHPGTTKHVSSRRGQPGRSTRLLPPTRRSWKPLRDSRSGAVTGQQHIATALFQQTTRTVERI
jgi:hypothetical protein